MAHDVFISHAHKDRNIANAICEKLEAARVKCWIAERDISAGEDWTKATRDAIGSSRVMVLILSENANVAPHIEREIAHAFYTNRTILPVRLTKTPPRRDFLFYLDGVRWFDAASPPAEQDLKGLIENVNAMMHGGSDARNAMLPDRPLGREKTLELSDSWLGALRASHYRSLEILKRASIAVILLSSMWLLWFVYSQWKDGAFQGVDNLFAAKPVPSRSLDSPHRASGDQSPPKPAYTFSRLGLWVAPHSTPANPAQDSAGTLNSTAVPPAGSVSSSPQPELDHTPGLKTEGTPAGSVSSLPKPELDHTPGLKMGGTPAGSVSSSPQPELDHTPGLKTEGTPAGSVSSSPQPELDHTPGLKMGGTPAGSVSSSPQPELDHTPGLKTEGTPAGSVSSSPKPELDHTPDLKTAGTPADSTDVRSEQGQPSETADRSVPVVPPVENEPAPGEGRLAKSARINQDQAGTTPATPGIPDSIQPPQSEKSAQAQPTPSAGSTGTAAEGQPSDAFSSTSEEQSLKNMVRDYMRTAASNDDSTQERFFAARVNFYGKGLLSPSAVRASLERYRHQWPVRNWEPQGEPEFPKRLHSQHPELYEVLQPFVWTVANGSERKRGNAMLYIRALKNDKGEFRIIHIEQRHP